MALVQREGLYSQGFAFHQMEQKGCFWGKEGARLPFLISASLCLPMSPSNEPVHRGRGYLLRCCQLNSATAKTSSGEWGKQRQEWHFFLPPSPLGFLLDIACSLSWPQQEPTLSALGVDDFALAR